jgi:hypothetical protein
LAGRGAALPGETPDQARNDEYWRNYLTQPDSMVRFGRRVFTHIPSEPRCRMCTAPFAGPGGPIMRLIGKRQSPGNPNVCSTCHDYMVRYHGGAEVPGAMLFADIRGSTALAESMSTADFHALLDRFYSVASQAVFEHDGMVDKFVGDELVANFFPSLAGERYVARAIDAARSVLRATGHGAFVGLLSGTIAAAVHHGLSLPAGASVGIKGGWLTGGNVLHTYASEMAANCTMAYMSSRLTAPARS